MLNQIVLVGRLVRDPEVKKAKNDKIYAVHPQKSAGGERA